MSEEVKVWARGILFNQHDYYIKKLTDSQVGSNEKATYEPKMNAATRINSGVGTPVDFLLLGPEAEAEGVTVEQFCVYVIQRNAAMLEALGKLNNKRIKARNEIYSGIDSGVVKESGHVLAIIQKWYEGEA